MDYQAELMRNSSQQSAISQAGQAKQPTIRERVQEAQKRLSTMTVNLSYLADAVAPNFMKGLFGAGEAVEVTDSTLASDVDDLIREIGRIEGHVQRISTAITG